jgi:hypothetical protein
MCVHGYTFMTLHGHDDGESTVNVCGQPSVTQSSQKWICLSVELIAGAHLNSCHSCG